MKKEKMILVPAAFLMTAMLAFPVMASEGSRRSRSISVQS